MMTMAGSTSNDYVPEAAGSSSVDGSSSIQRCQSVECLGEWRSCDQVENGTPSTSPAYWDSEDDDDSGSRPSDLYGKYTWKIDNFSQISKRELRSNLFEVGSTKWYILIYPHGCDACNHLSLFLCVANHDKLLPGWSHFALFTIAVVNKDPKKNKYNDTLHRFWKKEHDWGWKKFMERNKVTDGFVDDDTLTIKAQVQVIREKAHRPFRCLDCQYRRELIRVYLSAVEQTCVRFVDEKRQKLQNLIGDKTKWSSFCAFWLGIEQNTRHYMSRDTTDAILKALVKHFFIEKEVASTLVMDSLYSGLRAFESKSKLKILRANLLEKEELPSPIVFIENGMFVLVSDVIQLLERTALESPHLPSPSKQEKGLPTRSKDGSSGDKFNRDSILRHERCLTELGYRTLEFFVLGHIFSRIEIAYQEAVALKRQEELIREEEEAEQAKNEKREKKAKKKQARQRRLNRKGKDRGKDEKSVGLIKEKHRLQEILSEKSILEEFSPDNGKWLDVKCDIKEDVFDVSDHGDDGAEALCSHLGDQDTNPLSWDAETSEIHPTAEACKIDILDGDVEKKSSSIVDDSSSTCSTDSVPSIVVNGPYKGSSSSYDKNNRNSPSREKKQQKKNLQNTSTIKDGLLGYVSGNSDATGFEPKGSLHSLNNQRKIVEPPATKEKADIIPDNKEMPSNSKLRSTEPVNSSANLSRQPFAVKQSTTRPSITTTTTATANSEQVSTSQSTSNTAIHSESPVSSSVIPAQSLSISKSEALKPIPQPVIYTSQQTSSMLRPSSASVNSGPKPSISPLATSHTASVVSQTLPSTTIEPQSYRNVIMGIKTAAGAFSSIQSAPLVQLSSTTPQTASIREDQATASSSITFGSCSLRYSNQSHSSRPPQGVMPDEFPHLDIINDLLDEDHRNVGMGSLNEFQHRNTIFNPMNQQYTLPADLATTDFDPFNAAAAAAHQFDLPEYYHGDMSHQMVCDPFMPFYGVSGDMQPLQLDFLVYDNAGLDSLLQNHWPVMDANGFAYQFPEYSACGVDGYSMMYQSANGL